MRKLGEKDVDGMNSTFMMRWNEAVVGWHGLAGVIQTLGPIGW
jgi:hypothetical protein